MVIKSININTVTIYNNHLSPQIIENKKEDGHAQIYTPG